MRKSYEEIGRMCMFKPYHYTRKYRYWVEWNREGAPLMRVPLEALGTTEYDESVEEVYKVES